MIGVLDLPSVRACLEEERHVAGGGVGRRNTDHETNEAHADGRDDVPELSFHVSEV